METPTDHVWIKTKLLTCILLSSMMFTGCLTRRNAIPPHKPGTAYSKPKKDKNVILTDATSAPRDIDASRNLISGYAAVLGVDERDLRNKELYAYIDRWMGTPHRLGGTDRNGMDCSAFVGMVAQEVYGKSLPRTSRDMAQQVKRKYERQLLEGDLVFFSFGQGNVDHVGIYLHNNKFVHVSTSKGVIISDLHDKWYYKYFTRAGSIK